MNTLQNRIATRTDGPFLSDEAIQAIDRMAVGTPTRDDLHARDRGLETDGRFDAIDPISASDDALLWAVADVIAVDATVARVWQGGSPIIDAPTTRSSSSRSPRRRQFRPEVETLGALFG